MTKQKTPSFAMILFGQTIVWSLPVIVFLVDEKVFPYIYLYSLLGFIVCLPAAYIASKRKNINGTLLQKLLPILGILVPFWLIAAYPLSVVNFLLTIALVVFGVTLPLWNRYFTWWFYTLGGMVPLPEIHNWLINKENKKDVGEKYQNFVKTSVASSIIIGILLVSLTRTVGYSGMILIMKFLSMFIVFSMGLTFGADIKKKQLGF